MSAYEEMIRQVATPAEEATPVPVEGEEYKGLIADIAAESVSESEELARLAPRGITFGFSDILRGVVDAEVNDKDYDVAFYEQRKAREAVQDKYPAGSLVLEILGSLPTGLAMQQGLTKAGVKSFPAQGAIEGGLYGLGTEGPLGGIIGAGAGTAVGALFAPGVVGAATKNAKKVLDKAERDTLVRTVKSRSGKDLTDEELEDEIIKYTTRDIIEKNRFQYGDAEKWAAKLEEKRAAARKAGKDPDSVVMDIPQPEIITPYNILNTAEYMASRFGATDPKKMIDRVYKQARKMGGLRFDSSIKSVDDLIAADKMFKSGTTGRTAGPLMRWYERNFSPVTETIRRYYSPQVATVTDRIWERSMRSNANFMDNMVYPMKDVIQMAETPEYKAMLLDVHIKPENLAKFRGAVKTNLGDEQLAMFDQWWAYANNRNTEARQRLYKRPQVDEDGDLLPGEGWDVEYMHSQKRSDNETIFATLKNQTKYEKVDSLRTRQRQPASMMSEEELADWVNPILAHSKYVMDNEVLIEGTKRYGLAPSLTRNGSTAEYFDELEKRLARDLGDENGAKEMANILNEAYRGSKLTPPAPVRTFMNLSYAGTLAQVKSATLNLHDIAVSMVNNGVRPTLKAVFNRTDDEFGKTVKQMMGEQNFGEFVREFDKIMMNPGLLDKISWGSKVVSDGAMAVSGFAFMDRVGKGAVLRSAVNAARDSAKSGRFRSEYADFFLDDPAMAVSVEDWLRSGRPVKEWDSEAAEIIEDIAFSKLGEQQLITAAGRPLGYLNHPILRPAYAMTGFAIKQQALLRRNVVDELRKGNPKKAAQYAAKYAAYAGLGYGFLNETRNAIFKGDDFEEQDIMLGAVDQVAAALSLNRLGDSYSRQMFMANPIDYLIKSFVPPGGLTEAAGKALMGDWEELVYRTPGAGDFLKLAMKED